MKITIKSVGRSFDCELGDITVKSCMRHMAGILSGSLR